jgi:hypothetical protein
MTAIRNISPRGDLDVPLLRRVVAVGEVVDVDPAHAEILLEQVDNWQPAADGGIVPAPAAATVAPELAPEPAPAPVAVAVADPEGVPA